MFTNSGDYNQIAGQIAGQNKNKIHSNDAVVKALKSKKQRAVYWCLGNPGLGIRVSPKGTKTWIYAYRFEGTQRYYNLGRYPACSLAQARKLYIDAAEKVESGIDPAQEKIVKKAKLDASDTIEGLVSRYILHIQKTGKRSWKEEERTFKRDLLPNFGDWKAHEVKKKNISEVLSKIIIEREAPSMASHLLRYSRLLFEYAEEMGIIPEDSNPCSKIKLRLPKGKGSRHLSPREIYQLWHGIEECRIVPVIRLAIRMMLCTMTRSIEIRTMKWSNIDDNENVWTIPDPKNRRPHRLYLHRRARQILEEVKDFTGNSEYVFASTQLRNIPNKPQCNLPPMVDTAICQTIRMSRKDFGIAERFTPHDLRRTGATFITALGCPRHWAKLLLNHTDNDVTAIYDLYSYEDEKKTGLEILDYAINRIITSPDIDHVNSPYESRHLDFSNFAVFQNR